MTCASIAERYRNVADPALERDARDVEIVGTVVFCSRVGGSVYLLRVQDVTGGLQICARRDAMLDDAFERLAGVTPHDAVRTWGSIMRTRSGEITLRALGFEVVGRDEETVALNAATLAKAKQASTRHTVLTKRLTWDT